jgi:DNA polymerase III subunit epsilon
MKTLFLDLETTGLNRDGNDEILEIAIIDNDGKVLMNTLVKPIYKTEWPEAQAINGISPAMVANAKTLAELTQEITDVLMEADELVVYNFPFDWGFLSTKLRMTILYIDFERSCAMERFSEFNGVWDEQKQMWKRQKLAVAAEYFAYVWPEAAHRALADTFATKHVWEGLNEYEAKRKELAGE